MAKGWNPVAIRAELYETAKECYERNKEQIKLKEVTRSLSGFLNFAIREHLKEKGII